MLRAGVNAQSAVRLASQGIIGSMFVDPYITHIAGSFFLHQQKKTKVARTCFSREDLDEPCQKDLDEPCQKDLDEAVSGKKFDDG